MERRAADFATGVRDAINSNNTTLSLPTGSYSLVHASAIPSPSYAEGRTTGNMLSLGQGVVQMLAGGTTAAGGTAGGVVAAPTGVGAVAGLAVAAGGLAVAGYSTASNAARNLFGDNNGRVNTTPSSRQGKDFTLGESKKIVDANAQKNNGKIICEGCGVETTKPEKSQKGVTPPKTDRQIDHMNPKSKGGSGTAENGQVLCRTCNRSKSDR